MALIERVLDRRPCATLNDHLHRGGGEGLRTAERMGRDAIIAEIEASGLRGRGGAGFPTGVKWRTVAAASVAGATPVVVNAAEGEPATFKDRELIRINPFKIVEGALIAALVVDASEVVFATKSTFGPELTRVRDAIAEVRRAGWAPGVDLRVVEGPSEYLFGEETGLLEVLDGRQPFPRIAPPYRRGIDPDGPAGEGSAAAGDEAAPALVDNVETLANVPGIIAGGADWFRSVGTAESPGTIVCTMIGHCQRPAVGEVPMGTSLREAIELIGGGAREGRRLVGAMSGVANAIVPETQLDTALTYEAMAAIGSGLGAGGFYVCDDETDVVAVAAGASRFLAVESCGQCEPCKRDGLAIAAHLDALCRNDAGAGVLDELRDRLATVADGARCFLASQQQRVVGGALEQFTVEFRGHADRTLPAVEVEPIVPLVDLTEDGAELDTAHLGKQPDWSHDAEDSGKWPAAALGGDPVELDAPESRQGPADPEDVVATGAAGPDPLRPLLDLQAEIRAALDDAVAADERARPAAVDVLRDRLALHDDVAQRVVHPMAARVAAGEGDDATWQAEHDEALATRLFDLLGPATGPGAGDEALTAAAADVRRALDGDEAEVLDLLRQHMDDEGLRELGDAVEEAVQTYRPAGDPAVRPVVAGGAAAGTRRA